VPAFHFVNVFVFVWFEVFDFAFYFYVAKSMHKYALVVLKKQYFLCTFFTRFYSSRPSYPQLHFCANDNAPLLGDTKVRYYV
jgi:hypothetical protein